MNKNFKNIFKEKGYFVIKNVITNDFVNKILSEIEIIKDADFYYDENDKLRRIERLYNKGENLKKLNKIIIDSLYDIFNENYLIFKDKFNAKPPGGKGFFPHFDGVFEFRDSNNKTKKGWYEYGDIFINVLTALDDCTNENGTIEIANKYASNDFDKLIHYTKKNGTPELNMEAVRENIFEKILLQKGDMVFFSNLCPHKSKTNNSKFDRRTLYYTYLNKKFGYQYENYFLDKKNSQNKTSKSLDD